MKEYQIRLVTDYRMAEDDFQTRLDLDFGGERLTVTDTVYGSESVAAEHIAKLLRKLADHLDPVSADPERS